MSHEIEAMMYVGDVPWHGLGQYVGEENVGAKKALEMAGLDWKVVKRPLFRHVPDPEKEGETKLVEIPDKKALVRDTDEQYLSTLSNQYVPFQNHEGFDFLDVLVEEGKIRYHTAGSLRDGKRIWILGRIAGQVEVVPGDVIDKYVMLWNAHDGSSSIRILPTAVRVVCANTASLALAKDGKKGVRIRHGKGATSEDKLELAREALGLAHEKFDEYSEFATTLVGRSMNEEKWKEFSEVMFPDPDGPTHVIKSDGSQGQPRNLRAVKNRNRLRELFESGRGQNISGVSGTFWAAYNAVTEYANYKRTTRGGAESRFESSLFGSGHDFVETAVGWLKQAA